MGGSNATEDQGMSKAVCWRFAFASAKWAEAVISKICSASLVRHVKKELLEPVAPRWWRSACQYFVGQSVL